MRARNGAAKIAFAAVMTLTACALTADLDGLTGGSPDAAVPDATLAGDAFVAADAASSDAGTPRCAGNQGPSMVQLDAGYCIDATEVTAAQYRAFLAARGTDTSGQPAGCAWNTRWDPANGYGTDDDPIFSVNWCQARAYCAWAGKRLCGVVDGHGKAPAKIQVATSDAEWFRACTGPDHRTFPYGNTFDAGACNVNQPSGPQRTVWPVGSHPACQGALPGLYDLDGNVWEWDAYCDVADEVGDASTPCAMHGASYGAAGDGSCAQLYYAWRDQTDPSSKGRINDVGIRCCADVVP